jgi:hypothetical protein
VHHTADGHSDDATDKLPPDYEPPTNLSLSRVVLMMILRGQGFANVMRDLLAAAFTSIDSRVENVLARFVEFVEGLVI